jgi:hypothetical protein
MKQKCDKGSTLEGVYRKPMAVGVSIFSSSGSCLIIFLHPTFKIPDFCSRKYSEKSKA